MQLDPDHPGFRDREYRARRNAIARLAANYEPGLTKPDAPYTDDEYMLWLDLEAASRQQYDPTKYQPILFCADSFEQMYRFLRNFLIRW